MTPVISLRGIGKRSEEGPRWSGAGYPGHLAVDVVEVKIVEVICRFSGPNTNIDCDFRVHGV